MATEIGWLIESDESGTPVWAAFELGCPVWMKDANDACRFARKEDAEQHAHYIGNCTITEHAFDDGEITAEWAVKLIKELSARNIDADYREAVLEIVASVR